MPVAREDSSKGAPHQKGQHSAKRERTRADAGSETKQLIFTLNAATGAVIRIDMVDPHGKRYEVPRDETIALAGKDGLHEIEAALDDAFEAGISSLLEPTGGDEPGEDSEETEDSDEEKELRRVLLMQIIGRDVRRRLQRRLVQRFILSRTLAH
jgi:hypothetical protein